MLPIAPEVLDGVEFRCVPGQALDDKAVLMRPNEVLDEAASVGRKAVPDNQQRAAHVPEKVFEKLHDLRRLNRSREEPEVEVPDGHSGDGRQQVPVEVVLEHGGLPFRSPRATAVGPLAQSAFVDEDDGAPIADRPLFSAGQRFFFQSRIFSSSLSRARPSGRWQLQRIRRSKHQTLLML